MVLSLAACDAGAQLLVNPALPITHTLYVQPIVARQTSFGGETATFFGDSLQQAEIEGYVDLIWAQAGINVTFLAPVFYDNDFAYDGAPADYSSSPRPESDMTPMFTTGPVSTDPTVLNMFFLGIVPGFTAQGDLTANGLSFLDRNGVAIYIGETLLGWDLGRQAAASVVAHEIGHSLGVNHLVESQNLMEVGHTGHRINSAQVTTIFTDNLGIDGYDLLVPVPEPSAGILFVAAFGLCAIRRRR
ncbi:MAG TPA: PEP-CTERM sorting domain-containing protein [Luteolibacter sp.]|nr:PEP-CTERM sorting domain-containing protein [Luteolibacter sp.]